jgi:hypothetical protein
MYMKLLYEELATLWERVNVWDAYEEDSFNMKGLLLIIVQDYPTLGYQYFKCGHGYKAWVQCMDDTTTALLLGSHKKMCTWGIEDGLYKVTHGDKKKKSLTIQLSCGHDQVRGARKKYLNC